MYVPRAKSEVPRQTPYSENEDIQDILTLAWGHRDNRRGKNHVFLKDGRPIKAECSKTAMQRAWAAAEMPFGKPWKNLRATFCTNLMESGVEPEVVDNLMGWRKGYCREHYYRPWRQKLAEAVGRGAAKIGRRFNRRRGRFNVVGGTGL
jgi:hypothetical protein